MGIFTLTPGISIMSVRTWDALVEDDYVSVMPLPYRKKMGVTYIFPPTMTQQLGVFSHENHL